MDHLGPWLADRSPASRPGLAELPLTTDVAVIGGGLAGVACALFLAQGGARPVVLESRADIGLAASGRHPGLVFGGTTEPAFRLVAALGEDRARALYAFGRENLDLLAAHAAVDRCGGLWAAVDDREAGQLSHSREALDAIGVPVASWEGDAVDRAVGGAGFGPALFLPEDALVDPARAVTDLAAAAIAAGARIHVECPVRGLSRETDGVHVALRDRQLVADVVVLAAEPWLPAVHEFFEDKIQPYREQALLTAPVEDPPALGLRAQYGYFTARAAPSGGLVLRGARWATPHMEVGETAEAPTATVQGKIDGFLASRFGLEASQVVDRWAWIEAMSCDGLPIVGPIPGSARFVCCAGFNGNEAGLGVRAARAVADGLLHGRAPGVPRSFSPDRFVG